MRRRREGRGVNQGSAVPPGLAPLLQALCQTVLPGLPWPHGANLPSPPGIRDAARHLATDSGLNHGCQRGAISRGAIGGGPGWTRTSDQRIMSPLL